MHSQWQTAEKHLANTFSKLYKCILHFGQIHLIIWTNIFKDLEKYIVQFEDALLAVSWRRTRGSCSAGEHSASGMCLVVSLQ